MNNLFFRLKVNAKLTYALIITNIIIWLATEIAGGSTNSLVLLRFGALFKELVLEGEIWRLISCAFLHIGPIHLLVNSYTLYQLGTFIEKFFGQKKLLSTYVITAITSSILSLIFTNGISAGASGALFGLAGLLLGNGWAKKTYVFDLPIDERQLVPFIAYNLIYGMINPAINNWAHIGGLLGGIVLGFIFDPAISFDPSRLKRTVSRILAVLSIIILVVSSVFWLLSVWGMNPAL
ncbi:rhomboid family intramembrane serine protease [Candidatus Dojkabacteria bacterium]|nr:rhomboid family intramembrane serine protease [Candidatus Dojkabacteria bacterium]